MHQVGRGDRAEVCQVVAGPDIARDLVGIAGYVPAGLQEIYVHILMVSILQRFLDGQLKDQRFVYRYPFSSILHPSVGSPVHAPGYGIGRRVLDRNEYPIDASLCVLARITIHVFPKHGYRTGPDGALTGARVLEVN